MNHVIAVDLHGTVRTLYTDTINLAALGPLDVQRASNVEYDNVHQGWAVVLPDKSALCHLQESAPPHTFGVQACCVFTTREAALQAEVDFLQAKLRLGLVIAL